MIARKDSIDDNGEVKHYDTHLKIIITILPSSIKKFVGWEAV